MNFLVLMVTVSFCKRRMKAVRQTSNDTYDLN